MKQSVITETELRPVLEEIAYLIKAAKYLENQIAYFLGDELYKIDSKDLEKGNIGVELKFNSKSHEFSIKRETFRKASNWEYSTPSILEIRSSNLFAKDLPFFNMKLYESRSKLLIAGINFGEDYLSNKKIISFNEDGSLKEVQLSTSIPDDALRGIIKTQWRFNEKAFLRGRRFSEPEENVPITEDYEIMEFDEDCDGIQNSRLLRHKLNIKRAKNGEILEVSKEYEADKWHLGSLFRLYREIIPEVFGEDKKIINIRKFRYKNITENIEQDKGLIVSDEDKVEENQGNKEVIVQENRTEDVSATLDVRSQEKQGAFKGLISNISRYGKDKLGINNKEKEIK